MSPLERAARALNAATRTDKVIRRSEQPDATAAERAGQFVEWENLSVAARARYFAQARVVILAIRYPSDQQLAAVTHDWRAEQSWRTMIDALLTEGE